METPDITKMLIEMSKDVQEIKTSLKYMTENCKQEKACLDDIDKRLEIVENKWAQIDGAWKFVLIAVSMGASSFLFTLYNWIKLRFGV